jgi:hypothetical protein
MRHSVCPSHSTRIIVASRKITIHRSFTFCKQSRATARSTTSTFHTRFWLVVSFPLRRCRRQVWYHWLLFREGDGPLASERPSTARQLSFPVCGSEHVQNTTLVHENMASALETNPESGEDYYSPHDSDVGRSEENRGTQADISTPSSSVGREEDSREQFPLLARDSLDIHRAKLRRWRSRPHEIDDDNEQAISLLSSNRPYLRFRAFTTSPAASSEWLSSLEEPVRSVIVGGMPGSSTDNRGATQSCDCWRCD